MVEGVVGRVPGLGSYTPAKRSGLGVRAVNPVVGGSSPLPGAILSVLNLVTI